MSSFPPNLNVQNRDNLKIPFSLSVNDANYVNSMVISCSTCQKEDKECTLVKCVISAVLPQFQFCRNSHNFSAKS